MSEILDKHGNSLAGGVASKLRPGGKPGNQNAAKRGNDTTLIVACTLREKSGWVKAARGPLSDWVRETLNKASSK